MRLSRDVANQSINSGRSIQADFVTLLGQRHVEPMQLGIRMGHRRAQRILGRVVVVADLHVSDEPSAENLLATAHTLQGDAVTIEYRYTAASFKSIRTAVDVKRRPVYINGAAREHHRAGFDPLHAPHPDDVLDAAQLIQLRL